MPAMLKGWVDRVWGPGVAFTYDAKDNHLAPALGNIRLFGVVTTYGSPWWVVRLFAGDAGRKVLMRGMKPMCAKGVRSFLSRPLRHGPFHRCARGRPSWTRSAAPSAGSPDHKGATFPATPRGQPGVDQSREALMWRIALMSLAVLAVALSACDQETQIAKPDAGDYEVVAAERGRLDLAAEHQPDGRTDLYAQQTESHEGCEAMSARCA